MLLLSALLLTGAGDIGKCGPSGGPLPGAMKTGALLDKIPGVIFTLGDNAYNVGSELEFERCYAPAWGRHKRRTRPSPGNHDYETPGARGYFAYYGENAGDPKKGYYAYELGAWRIYSLNSNCEQRGVGCEPGSPQEVWLRRELAEKPSKCVLAYWHHPRFSSGDNGDNPKMEGIWRALADHGAELVLAGHEHNYERFDEIDGIVSFVVGTGGTYLRPFKTPKPKSLVRESGTHGVLKLSLLEGAYEWEFVPIEGKTFTDKGAGKCR